MKYVDLLIITIATMIVASCETDTAKSNVKDFLRENADKSIMLDANKIKEIEVTECDSMISPIVIPFMENELLNGEDDLLNGKCTLDSFSNLHFKLNSLYLSMKYSWDMGKRTKRKEFDRWLRKTYKTKVTFSDGKVREPRVIMEEDGTTPSFLEQKVYNEIDDLGRMLERIGYRTGVYKY